MKLLSSAKNFRKNYRSFDQREIEQKLRGAKWKEERKLILVLYADLKYRDMVDCVLKCQLNSSPKPMGLLAYTNLNLSPRPENSKLFSL